MLRKIISTFIIITFSVSSLVTPVGAQTVLNLPVPGTMIASTSSYLPAILKGVQVNPDNPLQFDFLIDRGDDIFEEEAFKAESTKLIKYFLAALTTPEEQMWVNLSPYEKNRIIPDEFGATVMGRDLLAQDYMLKQLSSSLMYPEHEVGRKFWDRVYKQAKERFGTTDIPANAMNKIWIVPEESKVYEHARGAFIVESKLKVMLEEDYLALEANKGSHEHGLGNIDESNLTALTGVSAQIMREVLLPEVEREVNEGKIFANLRQIYNSMLLATWYKSKLKDSLLGKTYVDQAKVNGVNVDDSIINQKIYDQYVAAFKKGAYNFIKEEYDAQMQNVIPRKYFSGGIDTTSFAMSSTGRDDVQAAVVKRAGYIGNVGANFALAEQPEQKESSSAAMVAEVNFKIKGAGGQAGGERTFKNKAVFEEVIQTSRGIWRLETQNAPREIEVEVGERVRVQLSYRLWKKPDGKQEDQTVIEEFPASSILSFRDVENISYNFRVDQAAKGSSAMISLLSMSAHGAVMREADNLIDDARKKKLKRLKGLLSLSEGMMQLAAANDTTRVRIAQFTALLPTLDGEAQDIVMNLIHHFADPKVVKLARKPIEILQSLRKGNSKLENILDKHVAKGIVWLMEHVMAKRFFVGENAEEAIEVVDELREQGYEATVDVLGDESFTPEDRENYIQNYLNLLAKGAKDVSIKISNLYENFAPESWDLSKEMVKKNLKTIFLAAKEAEAGVTLDMEYAIYKDLTMEIFLELVEEVVRETGYSNFSIALQNYFKGDETRRDIDSILDLSKKLNREHPDTRIGIRLVKGANYQYDMMQAGQNGWDEPHHGLKLETDTTWEDNAEYLLRPEVIKHIHPKFATHNYRGIAWVRHWAKFHGVNINDYEFQFLRGMIPMEMVETVKKRGHKITFYAPFGNSLMGLGYLMRRLLENSDDASFQKNFKYLQKMRLKFTRDPRMVLAQLHLILDDVDIPNDNIKGQRLLESLLEDEKDWEYWSVPWQELDEDQREERINKVNRLWDESLRRERKLRQEDAEAQVLPEVRERLGHIDSVITSLPSTARSMGIRSSKMESLQDALTYYGIQMEEEAVAAVNSLRSVPGIRNKGLMRKRGNALVVFEDPQTPFKEVAEVVSAVLAGGNHLTLMMANAEEQEYLENVFADAGFPRDQIEFVPFSEKEVGEQVQRNDLEVIFFRGEDTREYQMRGLAFTDVRNDRSNKQFLTEVTPDLLNSVTEVLTVSESLEHSGFVQSLDEFGGLPGYEKAPTMKLHTKKGQAEMKEASRQVDRYLKKSNQYRMIIDGEEVEGDELYVSENPADTRRKLGTVHYGTAEHVNQAVEAARAAQPDWENKPTVLKVQIAKQMSKVLMDRRAWLADLLSKENGKNKVAALGEINELIDFLNYYSQYALFMEKNDIDMFGKGSRWEGWKRKAAGVVGVIGPFNFPAAIPLGMSLAAIFAGNTVVLKPSEHKSVIAYQLVKIMQRAGLPSGVLHLVFGEGLEVGEALVEHEDVDGIMFTGSFETGARIKTTIEQTRQRGKRPKFFVMETGGKNMGIVGKTADPQLAAKQLVASLTDMCGQRCSALGIANFVGEAKRIAQSGEFKLPLSARKFIDRLMAVKFDDPSNDPTVNIGPMSSQEGWAKNEKYRDIAEEEVQKGILKRVAVASAPYGFQEEEFEGGLTAEELLAVMGPDLVGAGIPIPGGETAVEILNKILEKDLRGLIKERPEDIRHLIIRQEKYGLPVSEQIQLSRILVEAKYAKQAPKIERFRYGYYPAVSVYLAISDEESQLEREEIFGPTIVIRLAKDVQEALERMNSNEFGLTGGMFSQDPTEQRLAEQLAHIGVLYILRAMIGAVVNEQAFGGVAHSGNSRKAGGAGYMEQMTHLVPPAAIDAAMKTSDVTHGGVDLNAALGTMDIQVDGNGAIMPEISEEMLDNAMNATGFVPVINSINMSLPTHQLFLMLGLREEEEDKNLEVAASS